MKALVAAILLTAACAHAHKAEVVDLPTRAGITERMLAIAPEAPKAVVILLTGGPGIAPIRNDGTLRSDRNFLLRSRMLFVQQGLATVVLDAPSDHRQGIARSFRESAPHVTDVAAAIAWARGKWHKPVWLIGTSNGSQSTAHVAVALNRDPRGPDGIVMSSSILVSSGPDPGTPVQEQPLDRLGIPVLAVHHEDDPCPICAPRLLPDLKAKLPASGKLLTFKGGISEGRWCEPFSHHGYNGIEGDVVAGIAAFINGH